MEPRRKRDGKKGPTKLTQRATAEALGNAKRQREGIFENVPAPARRRRGTRCSIGEKSVLATAFDWAIIVTSRDGATACMQSCGGD